MLSIIVSTIEDVSEYSPLFFNSCKDAELIIVDSNWSEERKNKLKLVHHEFKQITYAPPKKREITMPRDFISANNTGLAYAEEDFCMMSGANNEFKPDFFKKLEETIHHFGYGASMRLIDEASWMNDGRLKPEYVTRLNQLDDTLAYRIAIRPVELEANMRDTKWDYTSRFSQRYLFLPCVPIGKKDERGINPILTCGFIIMPRKTWYSINGFNEQYDVGCYWWDNDLFDRLIVNNIRIILDQELMIYRSPHISSCLPENPECKQIYEKNLMNFPKKSPNDFNLEELHEEFMEKKQQYIL
jgi:hypothetical protein